MLLKISEAAEISGVSVRTLQYYDKIGLLPPHSFSPSGYRYYGGDELKRLQQILFLRELDFSLEKIGTILDSSGTERISALEKQLGLLQLKKKRLDSIIKLAAETIKTERGEREMQYNELFEAFSMKEIEEHRKTYEDEAEQRWGQGNAFRQSIKKTSAYGGREWKMIKGEEQDIYGDFIAAMTEGTSSEAAGAAVDRWRKHISRYYYDCSLEILSGLGLMYSEDQRFRENIDKRKNGLAAFMSGAIAVYCEKK